MKTSLKIQVRTWYGVGGTVIIGPGFRHKSGIGNLIIPHPALVNWLLRLGLLEKLRRPSCRITTPPQDFASQALEIPVPQAIKITA
jgi:hypothetical protein